jgi:hypothetical protein
MHASSSTTTYTYVGFGKVGIYCITENFVRAALEFVEITHTYMYVHRVSNIHRVECTRKWSIVYSTRKGGALPCCGLRALLDPPGAEHTASVAELYALHGAHDASGTAQISRLPKKYSTVVLPSYTYVRYVLVGL